MLHFSTEIRIKFLHNDKLRGPRGAQSPEKTEFGSDKTGFPQNTHPVSRDWPQAHAMSLT